jgi:1-acyl-sn-glycerol-3-phosphate acyltransferase
MKNPRRRSGILRYLVPPLARAVLALVGWRVVGQRPAAPKYLIVAAHHTSSLDFPLSLLTLASLGLRPRWIGKQELFRGPLDRLMRALGGIPVDRSKRTRFVDTMVEIFNQHKYLAVAISPEGTRGKTTAWRTGFYYIAMGAGIPIALGFLDYRRRLSGLGPVIYPSGNLESDLMHIREFFAGVTGRHPERQGEIRIETAGNPDS